jgi:hypothetical protein
MKTKFLWLASLTVPLWCSCTNASSEPGGTNVVVQPAPVVAATNRPVAAGGTNAPVPASVPVGTPVTTSVTPPAALQLSAPAGEIVKLTQAGVDANVMLAYVTNSVNTFALASDEIVYLNDLGVPPAVMTAMIQHDQRIREASLAGATVTAPGTPAPAQSVWAAGAVVAPSNTWQQPVAAAAPAAEAEVNTAPPPPAEELPDPVTVNYFYDSLAPYGVWIDIPGYGRCWRPTVVASYPGWRPYLQGGRWLWTDCGWYWYSDYSWGWAPFHYGRWFSHPYWGWCWIPGSVWGPAWVTWSYSDAYCGWAPLPPAAYYYPGFGFTYYGRHCGAGFSFGLSWGWFNYVSYDHFRGHHYDQHCVPRHEARHVHDRSTVINNVIVGDNNTIINNGIPRDRVETATRSEVPRVAVRGVTRAEVRGGRPERQEMLATDGRSLTVARPTVPGRQPSLTTGSPRQAVGTPTPSSTLAPTAPGRTETGRSAVTPARVPGSQPPASAVVTPGTPTPSTPRGPVTAPPVRSENTRPPRAGESPRGAGGGRPPTPAPAVAETPAPASPVTTTVPGRQPGLSPASTLSPTPRTPGAETTVRNPVTPTVTPRSTPAPAAVPITRNNNNPSGSLVIIGSPNTRGSTPAANPATPWLNNNSASPRTTPAPVTPSTPSTWQSTVRSPSGNETPRNIGNWNRQTVPTPSAPIAPRVSTPEPVRTPAPTVIPSTPRVERSAPPRSFGSPSAQPFAAPARSYTPARTPAPSYSPPARVAEPRMAPAAPTPRSSPPSPSQSSSNPGRGSGRGDR